MHQSCAVHSKNLIAQVQMDPISIEKIRAMRKYSRSRRQQQLLLLLLPTLTLYMVATCVLCLLLTSPVWFPSMCSFLSSFLLITLPDLATAFLLSPKCLFVVGNLIIAFLIGESRLGPRREPASQLVNDIHEEHVKRNTVTTSANAATTVVVVADHSALVERVGKEEEQEGEEEELEKRVEDFIARVKKQRKLEAKSFFDTDR